MRVSSFLSATASTLIAATALFVPPTLAQPEPTQEAQRGIRGRVIVAPELLGATEWPVDATRAAALRTPANVRRGQGRKLQPMTESLPDIAVILEGPNVRPDNLPPRTLVIQGMRFSPGQALLARPGPIAVENKQGIAVTLVDEKGNTLKALGVDETAQISLPEGQHVIAMKELPYAVATVKVLPRGRVISFNDETGDIPLVPIDPDDYTLSFYLGANELFRKALSMPDKGVLFIDATISQNTVVDVTIKDASVQIAVPVSDGGREKAPQE